MHTVEALGAEEFAYRRGDGPVDRRAVLGPITRHDRVGVVARRGADGLGAGPFLLACVRAFYDRYSGEFYDYPAYFTFQAEPPRAEYTMLDVWPEHKNVAVDPDPEDAMRAVTDRAVNVLLVPDDPGRVPDLHDATLAAARREVEACYRYAPDGRLEDPAFAIEVPADPVWSWYRDVIETLPEERRAATERWSSRVEERGAVVAEFAPLDLEGALRRLPA